MQSTRSRGSGQYRSNQSGGGDDDSWDPGFSEAALRQRVGSEVNLAALSAQEASESKEEAVRGGFVLLHWHCCVCCIS